MTSSRLLPLVCVACLSASCGEPPSPPDAERPAVPSLVLTEEVDVVTGRALREPMVVQHPSGSLFATGYSRAPEEATDPPNLYSSDDGGRSWSPVDVGRVEDGALGNSDTDLIVDSAGTLHLLTMGFDRERAEGTHVAVGRSEDRGESWRWHTLSRTRLDDRPWIGRSDTGRLHIIWNDGGGVRHAVRSAEGEPSDWVEGPRIHDRGGSSHLAMGPSGRLAVRITPASASGNRFDREADFIAVSVDDGDSWALRPAPGNLNWDQDFSTPAAVPRWVEPLAWTRDGRLHSLFSEGHSLWLATSDDDGSSWSAGPIFEGDEPLYYPLLAVGPDDVLGATWFSGRGESLRAHAALVRPTDRLGGAAIVAESPALVVEAFQNTDDGLRRDPAGEYFPLVFLEDGDLGVVLPLQASAHGDGFRWIRLSLEGDR